MNQIKVLKRDGSEVYFDISKIKKQIEFACKGTNINPLELESKISLNLKKKKIKTSEIQDLLIQTAKNDISIEQPQMRIVAGRLLTWQTYREIWKNTKIDAKDWKELIKYLVRNNYYKKEVLDKLNKFNIDFKDLEDPVNYFNDFNLFIEQILIERSKYLIKNKKGIIEYPFVADIANALLLAQDEKEFYKIFELLHYKYLSLATPFKRNLRRPNGNLGSCYILEADDNLLSIAKTWQDIGIISKEGGGLGISLDKIRPGNTRGAHVIKSKEINYWVKIINDIIITVDQNGARAGAITPALSWWHLDFNEFLEIKSELNGDLRMKAFDVFPQVVVDNYFIEKVKNKEDVYQFNHYEFMKLTGIDITELIGEELYNALRQVEELVQAKKIKGKKIKANKLWKNILEKWIEIGDFYISNKDGLNRDNPLKHKYLAKCGNLCVESYSLTKPAKNWKIDIEDGKITNYESDGIAHSCNLLSINVASFSKDNSKLNEACEYAVKLLDRSIDLTVMPVKDAQNGSQMLRNIGIGIVGLADYMAYNHKMYNTEDGIKFAKALMERIAFFIYRTSHHLAKEKGSYPLFQEAKYNTLFGKDPKELNEISRNLGNNFDWEALVNDIKQDGIRNGLLIALAPNSSTALVQGVTASYLPAYNKFNYQTLADMSVPIMPKYIEDKFWFYKTKFNYKPSDIIKFTREIQDFVDTGISMEININPELTTIKEISDAIIDGFLSNELKAVYYSLTIDGKKSEGCVECAN